MGNRSRVIFLLFVLVGLWVRESQALIDEKYFEDITNGAVFIQNFGFSGDGKIQMKITNIMINGKANTVPRKMGFLLKRTMNNYKSFHLDHQHESCLFDLPLESFEHRLILEPASHYFIDLSTRVDAPGFYNIYFVNCEEDATVSFKAEMKFHNFGNNYLSIGETPLTMVYAMLTPLYIGACYMWYQSVYLSLSSQSKVQTRSIYNSLSCFFFLQSFYITGQLVQYHYWKLYGFAQQGILSTSYYAVSSFGTVILLFVLFHNFFQYLKISTIISQAKSLFFLIPLQWLLSFFLYAGCTNIHEKFFRHIVFYFLGDLVCIFLINRILGSLTLKSTKSLPYEKQSEGADSMYSNICLFRSLFWVLSVWILLPSLQGILDRYLYFEITWTGTLVTQTVKFSLLVYFAIAFLRKQPEQIQPLESDPLSVAKL